MGQHVPPTSKSKSTRFFTSSKCKYELNVAVVVSLEDKWKALDPDTLVRDPCHPSNPSVYYTAQSISLSEKQKVLHR